MSKNSPPASAKPVDLRAVRAEIDVLRQKITEKVLTDPRKAAIILTDWLNPPVKKAG